MKYSSVANCRWVQLAMTLTMSFIHEGLVQGEPPKTEAAVEETTAKTFGQLSFASANGKFRVGAELTHFANGAVTLRKDDGTIVEVPMAKLDRMTQDSVISRVSEHDDLKSLADELLDRFRTAFEGDLLVPKALPGKVLIYDVEQGLPNPHFFTDLRWNRRATNRAEVGTLVLVLRQEEIVTTCNTQFGAQFGAAGYKGIVVHHRVGIVDVAPNKLIGCFGYFDEQDRSVKEATTTVGGPFGATTDKIYVGAKCELTIK
jgi:uncharacterized cupin superfamily protein